MQIFTKLVSIAGLTVTCGFILLHPVMVNSWLNAVTVLTLFGSMWASIIYVIKNDKQN